MNLEELKTMLHEAASDGDMANFDIIAELIVKKESEGRRYENRKRTAQESEYGLWPVL